MNGELKLVWGPLQLNRQDAVDMVMNTPIINNGSDGKLVLIFINIEERSKPKLMLHVMSNTTDPSKFMTVHHITLNGDRTSDQSRALQKKIYRMQMKNYKKGLALLANISAEEAYANGFTKRTADQHRVDSQRGYNNGLALLIPEQRSANGKTGYANGLEKRTTDQHRVDSQRGYNNGLALLTPKQRSANGKTGYANGLGNLTDEQRLGLHVFTPEERRVNALLGYANGLALFTYKQRRANGLLGYEAYLAKRTVEQHSADSSKGGRVCSVDHLITDEVGMHDLARGDIVTHGNYNGTGTVKSVRGPPPNSRSKGRAWVEFHDKQVGSKGVHITSLCYDGKRCQFEKEYIAVSRLEATALTDEVKFGLCVEFRRQGKNPLGMAAFLEDHKSKLVSKRNRGTMNRFNRKNAVALATEVSKQL